MRWFKSFRSFLTPSSRLRNEGVPTRTRTRIPRPFAEAQAEQCYLAGQGSAVGFEGLCNVERAMILKSCPMDPRAVEAYSAVLAVDVSVAAAEAFDLF